MNKKEIFLSIFCVIGLCVWGAQAVTPKATLAPYESNSVPHGFDEIILQGDLLYSIGPNAIEAGARDDAVYIQFNQSFGNVSITIYNSSNLVVFSTVVDTSIQQVVIIPFANASADSYSVVLSHANNYAEGDFEKN